MSSRTNANAAIVPAQYIPARETPTGMAKLAEQAARAARLAASLAAVDIEAIPPDDLRYRPAIHSGWLKRIAERVVADRRAALLTDDVREAMVAALHADVAAANLVEDMEVLARHGFGESCNAIEVAFGLGRGRGIGDFISPTMVPMPARWVARPPRYLAPVVRDAEVRPSHQSALPLPAAALAWFDAIYALHQERVPKIMAVLAWPEKARSRTGKSPLWGEIFDQFDLIGEWIADQRDPARAAPDRGGALRTGAAAPSPSGEAA